MIRLKRSMVRKGSVLLCGCALSLIHFPFVGGGSSSSSSSYHHRKEGLTQTQSIISHISINDNKTPLQHMSAEMTLNVTIHGLLLWASMGFLLPLAILIIRMSHHTQHQSPNKLKIYFYSHLLLQVLSVLLATVGAIMSLRSFENTFNNKHQKIGLALYFALWAQAVIGFCRPNSFFVLNVTPHACRGSGKRRSIWYFIHWILGTIICLVGIINIYTGLEAYKKKRPSSQKSVKLWTLLFTAQVIFMAFFYVFQDKWDYIQRQGMAGLGILGGDPIIRSSSNTDNIDHDQHRISSESQRNSTTSNGGAKVFSREPCPKANALSNLFN